MSGHNRQRSRTHVHFPDPALNEPAAACPVTPPTRPWGTPAAGHNPIRQWGTNPTPPEPKPKRGGRILLAAAIGVVLLVATGVVANSAPPDTGPDRTPPTTPSREPTDPPGDDQAPPSDPPKEDPQPEPAPPPPPPAPDCDPSYPDVCLDPAVEDYDCASGSGNGPEYLEGPIRVLPPDPFDLDREGDGVGCENG
jgi:hypothetical protein